MRRDHGSTSGRNPNHDHHASSIVREIVTHSYRRYNPTNGRAPQGTEYGVDRWLFDLPGETLNGRPFPQRTYAAYQVTRNAELVCMVPEVGGELRQFSVAGYAVRNDGCATKCASRCWSSVCLPR